MPSDLFDGTNTAPPPEHIPEVIDLMSLIPWPPKPTEPKPVAPEEHF